MLERIGRALDQVLWPLLSTIAGVCLIISPLMLEMSGGQCSVDTIGQCFDWIYTFSGKIVLAATLIWVGSQIPIFRMNIHRNSLREQNFEKDRVISDYEDLANQSRYLAQELLNTTVKTIYFALDLDHNSRISLYLETGGIFQLISRYSLHPELNRPNRPAYPRHEGFIAEAWRQREFCINDLPDPATDFENYKRVVQQQTNISEEALDTIRMRSRSYYACAVADTRNEVHKGVLVIESRQDGVLGRDMVRDCLENRAHRRHLQDILEQTQDRLPDIEYAAKERL